VEEISKSNTTSDLEFGGVFHEIPNTIFFCRLPMENAFVANAITF
jgi:hypothetical protein